jgi:hypothetical protein
MSQTFKILDNNNDIISNPNQLVTSPLWVDNVSSLTTYFTSSLLTATQEQYYYEVVNNSSTSASGQFAVTYGHRLGSGSYSGGGSLNDSPTRAIYSQYRNILLSPADSRFTFFGGVNSDQIYVIAINRNRLKERLNAGTWQLNLAELNGRAFANAAYTGSNVQASSSNKIISLIDDSGATTSIGSSPGGRIYNVVSGSIAGGIFNGSVSATHSYGLVYPDLGIIVLNADRLNLNLSFNSVTASYTVTGSSAVPGGDNAWKLYTSISGAAVVSVANGFTARSQESIKSQIVFVRSKWNEFNYSNNPSFVTSSAGQTIIAQPLMRDNPQVYVTSVGLYDSGYNLVAVAKLSRPLLKSFDRETLIKVKIDF